MNFCTVCKTQLSLTSVALFHCLGNISENFIVTWLYLQCKPKVSVHWSKNVAALCWKWASPINQTL